MKIVVAADKFKHSLTSFEVCRAIKNGFEQVSSFFTVQELPLSDGGDGLTEIVAHYTRARKVPVTVFDPLFRPVAATYLLSEDGTTAFVEMAQASGLHLLRPQEYNCAKATSYGTGQLIRHAVEQKVKKIILGIGGSATNDAGIGMAAALGYHFLDRQGKELPPVGENLIRIHSIDGSEKLPLNSINIEVACDVTNYLTGPEGATEIYGPQKGAGPEEVRQLEAGMVHFAGLVHKTLGMDISNIKGGGAAGGMGAGCCAFAGAQLVSGIELLLQLSKAEKRIQEADIVITGEGKLDRQTPNGKVVAGVAALGRKWNKPVIALCGTLDAEPEVLQQMGIASAFSICNKPLTLEEAKGQAGDLLTRTAAQLAGLLQRVR